MTTEPQADAVEVTQADREAAADYESFMLNDVNSYIRAIRNGKHDSHPLTQAFARFEASLPTTPEAPTESGKGDYARAIEMLGGLREQLARYCLSALFGFVYEGESLCDEADRIFAKPNPRATRAVGCADDIIEMIRAALAAQGGEG